MCDVNFCMYLYFIAKLALVFNFFFTAVGFGAVMILLTFVAAELGGLLQVIAFRLVGLLYILYIESTCMHCYGALLNVFFYLLLTVRRIKLP